MVQNDTNVALLPKQKKLEEQFLQIFIFPNNLNEISNWVSMKLSRASIDV